MSGHSKWSTIKRKKAQIDANRGKVFSKLIKEITVAAREGGGSEEGNPRLRAAVQAAKDANMPHSNIGRAIKRGTGELPGVAYEEVIYEGYGPGGVAVMVEVLTDNRNRAVSEIRHLFSKNNGSLAESGAVVWVFQQKGLIAVEKNGVTEDDLMVAVLDAGAEDIQEEEDAYEVTCAMEDFDRVKSALRENDISYNHAELSRIPQSTIKIEGKVARQTLHLLESLEDHDDVQRVYSNFDIDDEELQAIETGD